MEILTKDLSISLLVWQLFILLSFVLTVYSLIHILKHKFPKNEKLIWVIVVLFLPIVGSLFYVVLGTNKIQTKSSSS